MHYDWVALANLVTPVIIGFLGCLIHKSVKTSADAQRAVALSKIAEGITAVVVVQNPNAKWATLLDMVVQQLKITPDKTTSSNPQILQRAATAALLAQGV